MRDCSGFLQIGLYIQLNKKRRNLIFGHACIPTPTFFLHAVSSLHIGIWQLREQPHRNQWKVIRNITALLSDKYVIERSTDSETEKLIDSSHMAKGSTPNSTSISGVVPDGNPTGSRELANIPNTVSTRPFSCKTFLGTVSHLTRDHWPKQSKD